MGQGIARGRNVADTDETDPQDPGRPDRSFMVASPLRWAVILVFVLIGAVILANGFGDSSGSASAGSGGGSGGGGGATTSPTPTGQRTTPPAQPTTPSLTGITVAIYNSTSTAGLANDERQKLDTSGWDVTSIGNTTPPFPVTTIYYLSDAKAQADFLKSSEYPTAEVKPAPPAYRQAKISVILGEDFSGQ
jgi:hypothetical protein